MQLNEGITRRQLIVRATMGGLSVGILPLILDACSAAAKGSGSAVASGSSAVAASASASATIGPLTTMTYAEPAPASSAFFAWWSIADKLGYFADEGIKTHLDTVQAPSTLVEAGQEPMCVSAGSEFLPYVAQNPNTDLTCVWTQVPNPYYWIVVRADSPYHQFTDLKGQTVGAIGPGSSTWWVIDALAEYYGMKVGTDIKKVQVPAGAALVQAFRSKQIAAGSYVDAQVVQADMQLGSPAAPLRLIPLPAELQKIGGAINLTSNADLNKNHDLYVGYHRALSKAVLFIETNTPAGMAIHLDAYPDLQQASETRQQAIDRLVKLVQPRLEEFKTPTWSSSSHPWGWTYPENFTAWLKVLPSLANASIDVSKLYTNDLVAAAHNFDEAAIKTQAQNYPTT